MEGHRKKISMFFHSFDGSTLSQKVGIESTGICFRPCSKGNGIAINHFSDCNSQELPERNHLDLMC